VELAASLFLSVSSALKSEIIFSGIVSPNPAICCQNAARTYSGARKVCYRCDCKYVCRDIILSLSLSLSYTQLSKDQAPKDYPTLRALTALIASLPATENKAFREEFETVLRFIYNIFLHLLIGYMFIGVRRRSDDGFLVIVNKIGQYLE